MNEQVSKQQGAHERDINVRDTVLVKQEKRNKFTPPYLPKPYKVVAHKGTMLTAERAHYRIPCNMSFFKVVPMPSRDTGSDYTHYSDIVDELEGQMQRQHEQPELPAAPVMNPRDITIPREATSPRHCNPPRDRHKPAYLQDYA